MRVPMSALEKAKSQSSFLGNLFCRFSDYLLAEVMQSATCNSFHTIQQRAATVVRQVAELNHVAAEGLERLHDAG